MAGAGMILPAGGVLVTYGPYMRGGAHTSQSNEAFDASLRARNPSCTAEGQIGFCCCGSSGIGRPLSGSQGNPSDFASGRTTQLIAFRRVGSHRSRPLAEAG